MEMTHISAGVIVFISCMLGVSLTSRPPYIECQSSAECGKEACCVIGMGRYSLPVCRPKREVGESCRITSDHEPVNTTLQYPDGVSVELQGVYYIFCPCQGGLVCTGSSSDNQGPQCEESYVSNHLYDYNGSLEDSAQDPRT